MHQKAALSQPPGAHVSEHSEMTDYLGAEAIWVSQQVSLWLHNISAYVQSLFWIVLMLKHLWMISNQENI